jgi:hypothetical protein
MFKAGQETRNSVYSTPQVQPTVQVAPELKENKRTLDTLSTCTPSLASSSTSPSASPAMTRTLACTVGLPTR